eukprot:4677284-Ditylum_brightwellii.AAC.1
MGANHPRTKFCRMIEEKLGLKEKSLTAHFGWRSGANTLADAGISMLNLKQSGRWASILAVEEYIEHSHASKKEHLTLLDTKKQCQKRKQTVLRGAVPQKGKQGVMILYAVMTAMTVAAATAMMTVKLTNWKKRQHQPFQLPCNATISNNNK